MIRKLDDYHKQFESYPATLNHLFANVAPEEQIPEDQIEQIQKDVDRETWGKHGMQDNDWMKIIYESDGNTYSFSHFGKDNKPGGIGIDTDVTYTPDDYQHSSLIHDARKTSPTFKQFLFEMAGSRIIFVTALVINLFLLFAIGLQFSRTSDRVQLGVAVLYCLFLIPACSAIAMLLTVLHLDIANSSGH